MGSRLAIALLAVWLPRAAHAEAGAKIFISADMEGLTGVVSGEQLGASGFEYNAYRELMTAEVNTAIAAARDAGASAFVVADSHGSMQNLLIDKLPADVEIVRGSPRPLGMMHGIDASFDGVIFIGYHASTTNTDGVRAHTFSSAMLADVKLNGVSVTEGAWNAALAGQFGVPVLAVSGDAAAVAEVKRVVGDVEGAVVKWPIGFHAARTLTPEAGRSAIQAAVTRGMARRATIPPYRLPAPIRVEIRFKNYRPAEVVSWLPGFTRVDAHAVAFTARDMVEAYHVLEVLTSYPSAAEP
jgi:D-amino peptidase